MNLSLDTSELVSASIFTVRRYQQPLHRAWVSRTHDRLIEIAHRRWGKDEIALNACRTLALERPASYWHCLPEYEQGRKALWTAVNPRTGARRIDEAFPRHIVARRDEQKMFIELVNGATWQIVGSDRYNSLVGSGVAGATFSEWALCNPSSWGYIRPMLEENGGWAAFITTPRGRNHAYDMLAMARKSGRWFAEVSSVHDTGALSPDQIRESLEEYQAIYGEDFGRAQYEQEYECSFNAAILGAYYSTEILRIRAEDRICDIEADPDRPVHRAWDIGVSDDTSIWWFQVVGSQVFVLDCYSSNGAGIEDYAEIVHARAAEMGWRLGADYVPHDAKVREWGTGRTRIESMRQFGLNPVPVPLATKADGINAVRRTLPRCVFHDRCEDVGIAALEQYRREWDDDKKTFRAAEVRDWTTHLADAFRYLSLSWRDVPQQPVKIDRTPPPGMIAPPPPPMH